MSPRKNYVLTVEGWPDLKKGKLYKGIIQKAVNKARAIRVVIENLDPTQLGRIYETSLPLPIRPSRYHKTCSFFMAYGIDATIVGTKMGLNDIVNTTIGMRFGPFEDDGSEEVDFERIENPSRMQTIASDSESVDEQLNDSDHQSETEKSDRSHVVL